MTKPIDYSDTNVARLPKAFRARKRAGAAMVVFARAAGRVETLEGPVACAPGDALVTGPTGERWPVRPEHFSRNYRPVPPTRMGEDGLYEKIPVKVWAVAVPVAFTVRTRPAGDLLAGKPGDVLVQYGPGEYAAVAAAIFRQTYETVDGD